MKQRIIVSYLLIFFLLSGMILIFSPNVIGTTNYFVDFDTGYVNGDNIDEDWITSHWKSGGSGNPYDFNVTSDDSYSGTYAFEWEANVNGRWNITNTDFEDISIMFQVDNVGSGDDVHNLDFKKANGQYLFVLKFKVTAPNRLEVIFNTVGGGDVEVLDAYIAGSTYYELRINKTSETEVEGCIYYESGNVVSGNTGSISGMDYQWSDWNGGIYFNTPDTTSMHFDDISYNGGEGSPGYYDGNITINVYNESTPSIAIPNWSILIYDDLGGVYYSKNNLNNPVVINHSDYTTGEVYYQIGAPGYSNRTYYADIRNGVNYILDAFLPYENNSHIYYIQVKDNTEIPIYDAKVQICKAINGSLVNLSGGFTNGYGVFIASLIGGDQYFINISKTGYDPLMLQTLIPDPDNYGNAYPIIYILTTDTEYIEVDNVTMDYLTLSAYSNDTMRITYSNLNTSNSQISFAIYDLVGDSLLTTITNTSSPNNLSILFDFSGYDLGGNILKVIATATRINGSTFTITKYYNIIQSGQSSNFASAAIAAIMSLSFCIFGLTLAHPKKVLGPIGIIIMVIGIAITAFAFQTWYIHLIQAIEIILLVIILLIFKEEGIHAI